jgi:hypothetical protein
LAIPQQNDALRAIIISADIFIVCNKVIYY